MKVKILQVGNEEKKWIEGREGEIVMRHDPEYLGTPKIKVLDDDKKEHYIWGIGCWWEPIDKPNGELTVLQTFDWAISNWIYILEEQKGKEILDVTANAMAKALEDAIEQMANR